MCRGIRKMERKSRKNILRNLIFFLLLLVITLWIILKDQSITQILDIIKGVKIQYVLVAILCMVIYIILEAVNIGRTLKILGEKTKFLKNIKYALIGFFFSSITPAASGGQPMQIYYMHKEKISVANSTLALLLNLTSMQIITISFALISLCMNYQYLNTALIIFFIVGITLNVMALTLLIIGIFSRRLSKWLVKVTIKVLKIFRIKNIEEKQEKIERELTKYQYSAKYLKENKGLIVKTLITTGIQFFIYYSITYWTYRSFGFNESNILEIVGMQSVLYATVSGIPSPGAVGVSEGAFIEIFRNVYPEGLIKSATLLNRGVNFYLFVIISGITVIINDLRISNGESK